MGVSRSAVWIATPTIIVMMVLATGVELARSYRAIVQVAYTKAESSGFLVAEWIAESFSTIEYMLRDSLYGFDETTISARAHPESRVRSINARFVHRASLYDDILFLGLFDRECVIQFGSLASIIGRSSKLLRREYCTRVMEAPLEAVKITDLFVSSTGEMNVSVTYPLVSAGDEVAGFALAGLDLSFFQRWLNDLDDPTITISIIDFNRILLARKPIAAGIGRPVVDRRLARFIREGPEHVRFRVDSPVDGIDRLWALRKIRDLPFVVAVGYQIDDVLFPWRVKAAVYLAGNLVIVIISVFLALAYHKNVVTAVDMERLAMNDPLTGLMNRRSFDRFARARIAEADQRARSAAAVMIDVDHFKAINDTHGHDVGDEVLRRVAATITSSFRVSDLVCRWGGEEFLVYLSDAEPDIARRMAERLRARIAATAFPGGIGVTVSQGVSTLSEADGFEDLVRRADANLYEAKRSGRDCIRAG